MQNEQLQNIVIEQFLPASAAEKLKQVLGIISSVQRGLYAFAASNDSEKLNILKIGTVFQIFFLDTLAGRKSPKDLKEKDWKGIYNKVLQYAVLEEGQSYSEFVFTLYADYIDISAGVLHGKISEKSCAAIRDISSAIRRNTELFHKEEIKEADYVEACLWLSLEAMIKLLSTSLTIAIGPDLADLTAAVSQLAFEYGRYVLYSKEQALLEKYLENQKVLDEQLQREYKEYLGEVQKEAEHFRLLVDEAFSPDFQETLLRSAALAHAAGVEKEEILTSVSDVDDFFMD